MSFSSIFGHSTSNLESGYFTYSEKRSLPSLSRKISDTCDCPSVNRSTDFTPTPFFFNVSTIMSPTPSVAHSLTNSTSTPSWLSAIAMFAMRPPTNEHTCLPSSCRMSRQACPTAITLLTVVPPFPHHGSSCRDTRHDGAGHTAPL